MPANSFIATAEAVSLVGARPRFADVDPATQLITAATLEQALTSAACCVIPVHLFGRTVEMAPIMRLARSRNLLVIEDAAQAHGARYRGQRRRHDRRRRHVLVLSRQEPRRMGRRRRWSSPATRELADRVRLLRSHGESPRYHHRMVGTTARLDAIQAAVLRLKLKRLDERNEARRRIAAMLCEAIADTEHVIPPAPVERDCDHVYHQFVIRLPRRDDARELLAERGIATGIHYPIPIHRSDAYGPLDSGFDAAPHASALANEILSLPMFPSLSPGQVERIAGAVREHATHLHDPVAALPI